MVQKFKKIFEFLLKWFPTEQHCIDYLEEIIWNNNPVSPYDPNSKVYKLPNNQYKCSKTNKRFNIKIGTIFENTKLSLQTWFYAFYVFDRKKGISSVELAKEIGVSQRTAWFVLHRLRESSDCSIFKTMLKDFVEIDETYLGGSNPNRHWNKKVPNSQGRSWKDKVSLLVMIKRGGCAIVQVVPNVKKKTLETIIRENVEEGSNVYTDEWLAYNGLGKWYKHEIVNHRFKQYVNGKASTNSAENFNSCLKRGIYGTYHWVKKKNVQRYANEFAFRYNARNYSDKERFDLMLSSLRWWVFYQQAQKW